MNQILSIFKFETIDIIGYIGQALFGLRFLIQWIASEKKKQSFIPKIFWYISLVAAIMILIYAIIIQKSVFIIGQLFGIVVYIRNIILYKNNIN